MLSEIMTEQIARKRHELWYGKQRAAGVTTHKSDGVELLKPWADLPQDVQHASMMDVAELLMAMDLLHYRITFTTPRWVIAEFMGHRKAAGVVSEIEQYGVRMGRIEVPADDGKGFRATHDFNGTAIFMLTACSEEKARAAAKAVDINPTSDLDIECSDCGALLTDEEYGPRCQSCEKKRNGGDNQGVVR